MKGRIPQSFIQDLIARTDIVELTRSRLSLKKRGTSYLALCPFHNEKTPSFSVSAEKQFYYCFGCGAHGNAIGFLMAFDRLEFIEAIHLLASQTGLEIPNEISTEPRENSEAQYQLLAKVATYYQQQLRASSQAIHYLKSRGLTGKIAKQFAIGYAPISWENLHQEFKDATSQQHLMTQGLLIHKENRYFDRFRHRIMFPIRDVRGRIIAFGGRTLGDDQPKYLNSPETALFHKGTELYGLHECLQQRRQLKRLIVVEGYLDVIALHQHQLTDAVATLGTATSDKHIQKLLRHTTEIIFCFDGDDAGRRAAWRALTLSLPFMRDGVTIRFLFLPQGEDPDSLVNKIGGTAFEKQLETASPLSEVFFDHLQREIPIRSIDDKAHFAKEAFGHFEKMPQGLYRQLLEDQLSKKLAIDFKQASTKPTPDQSSSMPNLRASKHSMLAPAYVAASVLLQRPTLIQKINTIKLPTIDAEGLPLLVKLIALLKESPTLTTGGLLALWEEDNHPLIATLAARYLPHEDEEGLIAELMGALQRLHEQAARLEAESLIRKAKKEELSQAEKQMLQTLLTKATDAPT